MFLKSIIRWALFSVLFLGFFSACHTNKQAVLPPVPVSTKAASLEQAIEQSPTFNGLTGFIIMDQASNEIIYKKNSDTYFTPASNTKILTLYTAMNILRDTTMIPALKYFPTQDGEVYIQGTGHPTFLNPNFPVDKNNAFDFLQKQRKSIVFCDCNFQDKKYGSGWSWDDFHYSFQSEKSAFPLYGNNVSFEKKSKSGTLEISPFFFKKSTKVTYYNSISKPRISRNWDDNQFTISTPTNSSFSKKDRPFRTNKETTIQLLSDTLHQNIRSCNNNCTKKQYSDLRSNSSIQEVYKQLMLTSDNFVAEQLLLLCADQLFDTLNVRRTINWAQDSLLQFLPQPAKWVDGSGLSRYNMITPESMVAVLNQLYKNHPEEQLFDLFPTGGENGTIKDWYGGLENPYVYAKTGTLRHIHCLSGYIVTKSGKRLVFSFMHNNYIGSTRNLKREMEKILQLIYAEF